MATTKVITELTEFNPGNPDYVLNATNAVTVSAASGANKYYFDGVYDGKFGLRIGTTILTGIPSTHPFTIVNNGKTSQITISGSDTVSGNAPDGDSYTFYYNTATITVTADFGTISYACSVHGYMGGLNNFVSVYSEAGLRMPSSNSAYSGPTVAEGMMRNEVGQVSNGSASCMQHYNGTDWKNFVNVVQCTTTTCDYPTTATLLYQMESNGGSTNNVPDTCSNYDGTSANVTYATGKYGNAGVFNGSNADVEISSSAINTTSPYTISMWLYITDVTQYEGIFANVTSSYLTNQIAFVLNNGTISIYSVVSNGNTTLDSITATPQSAIANNTWFNLVIVADRSLANKAKVFFNGVEASYVYQSGVAGTSSYSNIKIGLADGVGRYFTGSIDQIRFFPSALNQTQANQLANEVAC